MTENLPEEPVTQADLLAELEGQTTLLQSIKNGVTFFVVIAVITVIGEIIQACSALFG